MSASERIGWWQARILRRAERGDVLWLIVLAALALLVLGFGRYARLALQPRSAIENAQLLDQLDQPTRLPNAPVRDDEGRRGLLFDRMKTPHAIVAFYAPWCGPCQRELPYLVREIRPHADVLVVVSADEDVEATRRQLGNLGLADLGFFVDESRQLQHEARVTALPTTFLVSHQGAVLDRTMGYSQLELLRLRRKVDKNVADVATPGSD
jgi:thiol-disulfide isomerase/thioredoxin